MLVITITFWGLWKAVVAAYCARMILRCVAIWAIAPVGMDWRVLAWRCQWEVIGFIAATLASAATLQLSYLSSQPDGVWAITLALVGLRALIDLLALADVCRRRIVPPLLAGLRWRRFMLRLWRRKIAQRGLRHTLATAQQRLFVRRNGGS